jgi:hypothetical protein
MPTNESPILTNHMEFDALPLHLSPLSPNDTLTPSSIGDRSFPAGDITLQGGTPLFEDTGNNIILSLSMFISYSRIMVAHNVDEGCPPHLDQCDAYSMQTSTRIPETTGISPFWDNIPKSIQPTQHKSITLSSMNHALPTTFPQPKPSVRRQRFRVDPYSVLGPDNRVSFSIDPGRQKLLEYILSTDWYREDDPEPKLGTREANKILSLMNVAHNVSFPSTCIKTGRSLFTLLTDPTLYKCFLCGSRKGSAQRAVECARAHIGHRPFRCAGWRSGCGVCRPGQE